jgi:hypothetical protein
MYSVISRFAAVPCCAKASTPMHEQRPAVQLPLTCSVVAAVGPAQCGEEDVSIVQSSAGQAAKHVSLTSRCTKAPLFL